MPTINVRDTNLYYEKAGDGDVSLLFIHGMCGSAWNWEDQMNRLSSEFTCVAYDRRGHSRSEGGTDNQSDRTHTEDAAALIEALGLHRPVVVASSGGGVIAVDLLRRYPNVSCGAVLLEPPLFSLDPGAGQELIAEIGPHIEHALDNGEPRAAVDAFFQVVCTSFWAQADEAKRNRIRDNAPLLLATLQREAAVITPDDLAGIKLPVLVMAGATSHPVLHSLARTLAEHLPNVRFVEIEDCGHVIYAEKPAEFAEAVTAFAHEIAGATTASPAERP